MIFVKKKTEINRSVQYPLYFIKKDVVPSTFGETYSSSDYPWGKREMVHIMERTNGSDKNNEV